MAIRLSGLVSGMDTDSLVQELVSAYSTKKDKYVKAQTKLDWQMDAWKSLNTKVYSFYTKKLSDMRFSYNYTKKAVTVSDTTKATVSASGSAVNGNQSLAVSSLATTGYLTGAQFTGDKDGNAVKTSTKISDLSDSFTEGMINVSVDGSEKNINVTSDMTVAQFVVKLKEAGLNASFDDKNQRLFVSSKTSGEEYDFSLTGNTAGVEVLKDLGLFTVSDADKKKYEEMAAYTDSDLENFALNEYLKKQISAANKTYADNSAELKETNTKLNTELNYAKLSSQKKGSTYKTLKNKIEGLETLGDEITEKQQKQLDEYKETLATYDSVNSALGITITESVDDEGLTTVEVSEPDSDVLAQFKQSTSDAIAANKAAIKENDKAVEANSKLLGKTYETDDIKALEFTQYGSDIKLTVGDYESSDTYQQLYSKYSDLRTNAQNIASADAGSLGQSEGANRISGADSEIVLNGAVFTSNTNNYSINGLTITATGVTEAGKDITITTTDDIDGIYNTIKDFLKSYNELIGEMDTLYNASSAKGYEPLTDDEKEAMTDTEIEKWETKIKDSLLRRDSTLGGVVNTMKTAMSSSFKVGDKNYSLSSFGISTLGYFASADNEKGVYHIDGDSEDSASGNEDKLKGMLASDPDTVISFLSQLSSNFYDQLTKKMAGSTLSSAYTIYNDKQMQSKYSDYSDTIKEWEQKISDYEEKYYKQFSAMETALSKLQSSTSALSSLIGS